MKTCEGSPPSVLPNKTMERGRAQASLLICFLLTLLCVTSACCSPENVPLTPGDNSTDIGKSSYIDPRFTLQCHRREYTFKAVRYDESGRKCWQFVTVMSCWGRCDSGEVRRVRDDQTTVWGHSSDGPASQLA